MVIDHTRYSGDTLELAGLGLRLLAPDGVLVLTNYTHAKEHDARCPRLGIDAFIAANAYEVRVLQTAWHVFLQKRASPLVRPGCQSEYFDPHAPPSPCGPSDGTGTLAKSSKSTEKQKQKKSSNASKA